MIIPKDMKAQVGIGTTTPNASSMLDITSTNSGLLIPRVALTSTSDVATIASPVTSLLVYNSGFLPHGYYYWNGTLWVLLATGNNTGWSLTGNSGTSSLTNFLGTTDDIDVAFKRNGLAAGKIGATSTSFGLAAAKENTAAGTTAFGFNALAANTTAVGNTAVGYTALANSTAANNTAVGYGAGDALTTVNNTAIGFNALGAAAGAQNTAVGSGALAVNTAPGNTAIGFNSLSGISAGASTNNVAVGSGALGAASGPFVTVSDNTMVGYQAGAAIVSIKNTGVGSGALQQKTGEQNTAVGYASQAQSAGGNFNTSLGFEALMNCTGNYNTAVGYNAGRTGIGAFTNTTSLGNGANATASNMVRIGNASVNLIQGQVAWSFPSDRRIKSNIIDSPLGLDFIKTLRPVSYFKNNDENKKTEYGFIAQEVEEALNNVGDKNNGVVYVDPDGNYSVRYNDFIPITVKAVQDQQELIEQLLKTNEKLLKDNQQILKRLEALEKNKIK